MFVFSVNFWEPVSFPVIIFENHFLFRSWYLRANFFSGHDIWETISFPVMIFEIHFSFPVGTFQTHLSFPVGTFQTHTILRKLTNIWFSFFEKLSGIKDLCHSDQCPGLFNILTDSFCWLSPFKYLKYQKCWQKHICWENILRKTWDKSSIPGWSVTQ